MPAPWLPDAVGSSQRPGPDDRHALRTIPIVRATGGLADTVIDADAAPDTGNGFSFVDALGVPGRCRAKSDDRHTDEPR
jgi:hypothetical protein